MMIGVMKTIAYIETLVELNAAFSGKLWIVALVFALFAVIAIAEFRRPATMKRLTRPVEIAPIEARPVAKPVPSRPVVKAHAVNRVSNNTASVVRPAY